jgi:hypothetical protein
MMWTHGHTRNDVIHENAIPDCPVVNAEFRFRCLQADSVCVEPHQFDALVIGPRRYQVTPRAPGQTVY